LWWRELAKNQVFVITEVGSSSSITNDLVSLKESADVIAKVKHAFGHKSITDTSATAAWREKRHKELRMDYSISTWLSRNVNVQEQLKPISQLRS
jgi:hypothetical protein